jgi:LacI family transcriptional regulator
LLDRGFERLAWFGPPPGTPDVGLVFDARAAGFTEGAAEAGVEVSIAPPGTWTPWHRHDDASLEALRTWLRSLRLPVGLFCVNLDLARRTVDLLLPIGLRIPADVALLGVDRDELLCETSNPTLSTIDHGMRRCGYLAAEQLDRMMNGQAVSDEPTLVPPVRVESRQSTDVIAVEDDEVRQALEIIRARAADGFTARDVSASVPLSRRMLELRFKKAVGCTLQAAIGQRRIETACGLLRELPNAKLGEIARRSGFTTATRLHEAFRRQLGTTPQRYREQQDLAGRSWPEPDRDATGGQAVP